MKLIKRGALAVLATAVTWLVVAAPAGAEMVKCQKAVAKSSALYTQTRAKLLALCEQAKIKGKLPASTVCATEAKTLVKLNAAGDKLAKGIATACGGKDKICGVDPDNTEDSPAEIGFPNACQNLENGTCDAFVNHCGDVAACLKCVADAATDQTNALYHAELVPGTFAKGPAANKPVNGCQAALSKETLKFLSAKSKTLQKCWDLRLGGKHTDACPDQNAAPKSAARKAYDAIVKAEGKMNAAICKACGGADKACGGPDDLTVAAIGFTASCTDVQVPGGQDCGAIGTIDTVGELAACVDCVTEYKVDCVDRGAVPAVAAYPDECNAAIPATCSKAEVTIVTSFTAQPNPDFVAGVSTFITYPGPKLEIPGNGGAPEVVARVTNLTGVVSGLLSAGDNDTIPDGFDDQLNVGLISTSTAIPPGNFVKVTFDCRAGAAAPTIGELGCTPDVSTLFGNTVPATCQVTNLVTTP